MKRTIAPILFTLALVALFYWIMSLMQVELGSLMDWAVGTISLLWLIVVMTVPWNAYFRAKEVLNEAKISQEKDIQVKAETLAYVRKIARNALIVAIVLHLATGLGLYMVAYSGISPVGYFSAGAAVLLTFLRPAVNYYDYLQEHLRSIRQEFQYPREDLAELLARSARMEQEIEALQAMLSNEAAQKSWRNEVDEARRALKLDCESILAKLEAWMAQNQEAHEQLTLKIADTNKNIRSEIQVQVDKITTDSQVLDSVRTLADFVRSLR